MRYKLRFLFVGIFTTQILGFLSFCCYVTFVHPREAVTSRRNVEPTGAMVNDSSNYSFPTVVEEQVAEVTTEDEPHLSPGVNVSLIIGRRPQRIELDESLRLDKVHFVIRTSTKFHHSRLELMLLTWLQTAPPNNVSSLNVVYTNDTYYGWCARCLEFNQDFSSAV